MRSHLERFVGDRSAPGCTRAQAQAQGGREEERRSRYRSSNREELLSKDGERKKFLSSLGLEVGFASWRTSVARFACSVACAGMISQATFVGPGLATVALTPDEKQTVKLFSKATPSVVFITNLTNRRDAFTLDLKEIAQGAGSGFVWDDAGHIVTNFHVIKGASDVQITFQDQEVKHGRVVGFDEDRDIAVLQLDEEEKMEMTPLPRGSSSELVVGQKVYALGNPFGLDHTLTTGIVSGLNREITR